MAALSRLGSGTEEARQTPYPAILGLPISAHPSAPEDPPQEQHKEEGGQGRYEWWMWLLPCPLET